MTIYEIIDTAATLNKILPTLNSQRIAFLQINISTYNAYYSDIFRSFDEIKTIIKEKHFDKNIESTILNNIEKLDFHFEKEYFDTDYRYYTNEVVLKTKVNQEVKISINLDF